jgi:hypothetical protein
MAGLTLPITGFSLRLINYQLLRWVLRLAEANRQSVSAHLSAWELDPSQPRMHGRYWAVFQQYHNLDKVEDRLKVLFREFNFGPLREAFRYTAARKEPTFAIAAATQK